MQKWLAILQVAELSLVSYEQITKPNKKKTF